MPFQNSYVLQSLCITCMSQIISELLLCFRYYMYFQNCSRLFIIIIGLMYYMHSNALSEIFFIFVLMFYMHLQSNIRNNMYYKFYVLHACPKPFQN